MTREWILGWISGSLGDGSEMSVPSQIEIVPPHKKDLSLKNPESRHPHPTKKKQPGSNIYTYNCIHNMHIDIYSTCFQTFIYIYSIQFIYIYTHITYIPLQSFHLLAWYGWRCGFTMCHSADLRLQLAAGPFARLADPTHASQAMPHPPRLGGNGYAAAWKTTAASRVIRLHLPLATQSWPHRSLQNAPIPTTSMYIFL